MPRLALSLLALVALAGTARADDDDPHVWPRRTKMLAIGGGAQYLRNESIGGPALFGELGLGRGRWQWVPNATVQMVFGDGLRPTGWGLQGGLDARWLARTFEPDSSASLQLFINAGPAIEHIDLGTSALTRPEIGVGWGVQVRGLQEHHWTIRMAFRFELAPALDAREVDRIVCRGQCTSAPSSSPLDEGFKTIMGVVW